MFVYMCVYVLFWGFCVVILYLLGANIIVQVSRAGSILNLFACLTRNYISSKKTNTLDVDAFVVVYAAAVAAAMI